MRSLVVFESAIQYAGSQPTECQKGIITPVELIVMLSRIVDRFQMHLDDDVTLEHPLELAVAPSTGAHARMPLISRSIFRVHRKSGRVLEKRICNERT